ncbi:MULTISPECIES: DUF4406 domain-containing protein [Vibrio]|uniref:Nucleoside 2-deoxyribosyltransferase n=1 Tax=Vibrio natriegens NBRC 15636 = ATCC 14048 = DSM 759 TaxID=1219067 RepID=A0AAN0Y307_VIBNA|nr:MULTISPECIES: DUF4406 domain-containing protein [Vibrio]ALR15252.1 nucleoside 2-deoxyribosyltransferase family protein [Vibrio natriegens NBRC 15636 = ATCC 14048 = DSM 759]ANQ12881.1 nucleoside 2-deoxyribosyltransferase [Vibrio natriegens NBRC 15636 = ATCC 14048 = DSM 759]EPM39315.1 hypothetical protein M272_16955 [Vibrio natriegens NBRC 15636 = ATCC 14048 = DSM 759]MBO0162588.1 DUF4406 domain-containing protein [Vibrio alginolyticus]MCS0183917.1 DUF4406 domain-containing protein [Vibrio al
MKKVYIAGPMTGLPEINKPAFFAMEEELKSRGCIVMNPAILPDGFEWEEYMHICIPMMACCDTVVFLDGWQLSKGARLEYDKAVEMGKQLVTKPLLESKVA